MSWSKGQYSEFSKEELIDFLATADKQIELAIDMLEVIQYGETSYSYWYKNQAEEALERIRAGYYKTTE